MVADDGVADLLLKEIPERASTGSCVVVLSNHGPSLDLFTGPQGYQSRVVASPAARRTLKAEGLQRLLPKN